MARRLSVPSLRRFPRPAQHRPHITFLRNSAGYGTRIHVANSNRIKVRSEQNAPFCSPLIFIVNGFSSQFVSGRQKIVLTTQSLFDRSGHRKYLVARERLAFVAAAIAHGGPVGTFCLTLALTGARISEALALTPERIDTSDGAIVFETLKQRRRGVFRCVPVPRELLTRLEVTHRIAAALGDPESRNKRLWPWGRTTAWKHVKRVMRRAGIADTFAKPKALRHAFGIEAQQNSVQLNMVQRWMGHARIETTAIYAAALGKEERALAQRTWQKLERALRS
jgi:integrase/recombinase XerD